MSGLIDSFWRTKIYFGFGALLYPPLYKLSPIANEYEYNACKFIFGRQFNLPILASEFGREISVQKRQFRARPPPPAEEDCPSVPNSGRAEKDERKENN